MASKPRAGQGARPELIWDPVRQCYFRYDSSNDRLLYEDGRSVPPPSNVPRHTWQSPEAARDYFAQLAAAPGRPSSKDPNYSWSGPSAANGRDRLQSGQPANDRDRRQPVQPTKDRDRYQPGQPQGSSRWDVPRLPSAGPGQGPSRQVTGPLPSQRGYSTGAPSQPPYRGDPGNPRDAPPESRSQRAMGKMPAYGPMPSNRSNAPAGMSSRDAGRRDSASQRQGQPSGQRSGDSNVQVFQNGDERVVQALHRITGVMTRYLTGPPASVTDPAMLRAGFTALKKLLGTSTDTMSEPLHPDFRVRPGRRDARRFFTVGRVFSVLWTEPAGQVDTTAITRPGSGFFRAAFGEAAHSKVRRFVVVREGSDGRSCTVCRIMTYSGRGVASPGVDRASHLIIYTGNDAPEPTNAELPARGQQGMRPFPIRVDPDPDRRGETLDVMSRLDLGRVYTVEHNIRVRNFGRISRSYLPTLLEQFQRVWQRILPLPEVLEDDEFGDYDFDMD